MEVSRTLTSELDLKDIIHQIMEGAIRVIPAADAGILFLYDRELRKLVVSHAVGFGPSLYDVTLEPGEGLSGKVFLSRRATMYSDYGAVVEGMSTAASENLARFAEATGGIAYPQSAISAALAYKGEALGAMIVENLYTPSVFDPFDVDLLDALAQVAAISIVNARLYESEREARLRLEALNAEMRAQRDQLERRLQVQDSLAEVVRDGLPLSALAARLARTTQGAVLILDSLYRVRAAEPAVQATTGRELRLADWESLSGVLRRASRTRAQQRLAFPDAVLLASPVTGGAEILGYVLVDWRDREPDAVDRGAVDSAALIAAADFLRERAVEEREIRQRSDLLDRLLSGEATSTQLGLQELRPPLAVAVGALRAVATAQEQNTRVFRAFLALVQGAVDRLRISPTLTVKDGHAVVILPAGRGQDLAHVSEVLREAIGRLRHVAPDWDARFAISEHVGDLSELAAAYHEARLALEIRERLGRPEPVFLVRDMGAYRLIARAATGPEAVELCRRVLGPVLEHDRRRGAALVATLRTYLLEGTSVKRTAGRLGVHPHTIQYRLERLQDLSGLRLARTDDRTTLELALRILDLAGPEQLGPLPKDSG